MWFLLGAVLASAAAASSPLAPVQPMEVEFVARDDGLRFWFEVPPSPERNPVVRVPANSVIRVHFSNNGTTEHNLVFDPSGEAVPCCVAPGGAAEFEFRASAHGSFRYRCEPHAGLGMEGELRVGTRASRAPAGGLVVAVLVLGVGALLRARTQP